MLTAKLGDEAYDAPDMAEIEQVLRSVPEHAKERREAESLLATISSERARVIDEKARQARSAQTCVSTADGATPDPWRVGSWLAISRVVHNVLLFLFEPQRRLRPVSVLGVMRGDSGTLAERRADSVLGKSEKLVSTHCRLGIQLRMQ